MPKNKQRAYEWLLLITGSLIYALSMVYVNRIEVIPGSMLGLAVTANSLLNTPIGMVNLLLNVPIMIFVTKKQGVKVLIYTIFIMVATSALMDALAFLTPRFPKANAYVIALIGGIGMGIGAGMLIAAGGTMAGTTALTLVIKRKVKRISFGSILFIMDTCIMLLCAAALKSAKAVFYSAIYGFIVAKIMDLMILTDTRMRKHLFQDEKQAARES